VSFLFQGLGFGCVNKIYLKFPYRWWPEPHSGFNLLWTDEDAHTFKPLENVGEVCIVFSHTYLDNTTEICQELLYSL
jgi:hypothetical protein